MAITLDPILAAAQDSTARKPIVEIISSQRGEDIPFDGVQLTLESFDEFQAFVIPHSSGRIVGAYCYGMDDDGDGGFKYFYTDPERLEFTIVTREIWTDGATTSKHVSLVEMADGKIGVIYNYAGTTNDYVISKILNLDGSIVAGSEKALISVRNSSTYQLSAPWVQKMGSLYTMYYAEKSGSDYFIYKKTSPDFLTWTPAGTTNGTKVIIGGLTSTWRLRNPSVIQLSNGHHWMFMEVTNAVSAELDEIRNLYYSISTDNGANWGNAIKLTAFNTYSEIGTHPVAIQRVASTMDIIFTKITGALHMDDSELMWPDKDYTKESYELSWDSVNRKLYVINKDSGYGLSCVVEVDIDNWTALRYWDDTTAPAFHPGICVGGTSWDSNYRHCVHDGHHIIIASPENNSIHYLDAEANTIKEFWFEDVPEYTITKNITPKPGATLAHAQIEMTNQRIWIYWGDSYLYTSKINIGWIDLTEVGPPYSYHQLLQSVPGVEYVEEEIWSFRSTGSGFHVHPESGMLVIAGCEGVGWENSCTVYDIETGAEIYRWQGGTSGELSSGYPIWGITWPCIFNNKVYAGMQEYTVGYGQEGYRGLVELDPFTGVVNVIPQPWAGVGTYKFGRPIAMDATKIIMYAHRSWQDAPPEGKGGIAIFDVVSRSWQLFNNDNVPGLIKEDSVYADYGWSITTQIAYDAVNNLIMFGDVRAVVGATYTYGIAMFSSYGYMKQIMDIQANDPGTGWVFPAPIKLVQGYLEADAGACVEPGKNSIYSFWTHQDPYTDERSIMWDKDGSDTNLNRYLLTSQGVETTHTIDEDPSTLTFTLSHGHLFDPFNLMSLLAPTLKKGRKIELRWGEVVIVGGTPTSIWQKAGEFYVIGTSFPFKKGDYPVIRVECEDQRTLWRFSRIAATEQYSMLPHLIMTHLLIQWAQIDQAEINIPAFEDGVLIDHQWIDTDLEETINQIASRFGHYFRFDVDGVATTKKISRDNPISHIYTDATKIYDFSADDKYSDFTNQVVVQGEYRSLTQLTYEEERIKTVSGTLGWWDKEKRHRVWFSEDRSRKAIHPRMKVLESAMGIAHELAGGIVEELELCPPEADNKYVDVMVGAKNPGVLEAALIGAVSLWALAHFMPDGVTWGQTIPIGRVAESIGLLMSLAILQSVANYQIEVHAQPIGDVRRSCQNQWDDFVHQAEIRAVNNQTLEDPLCYSENECLFVANFEGMVVQLQRNRAMFSKVAHLQDEEGDIIQVIHPYGRHALNILITRLTRTFKKPDGVTAEDGGFTDAIEGWVLL